MFHCTRAAPRFGAVLLAAGLAFPVHAEATVEGAAELTAVFQTYLGKVEGVVSVVPEGEVYRVSLDAAPLAALAGGQVTVSGTPFVFTLEDKGDGTWAYAQDQAISLELHVPGTLDMMLAADRLVGTGTYDSGMMAFREASSTMTGMVLDQTATEPGGGSSTTHQTLAEVVFNSTSTAADLGGVDNVFTMSARDSVQAMTMPATDGVPAMEMTYSVARSTSEGRSSGYRPEAVLALLAWAVAHPSEAAMTADRAGLKGLIEQGMPFFRDMQATAGWEDFSATTPFGVFGLASMQGEFAMNGLVADGKLREAFRLKGFTLPAGLVPDWAVPLVPEELALDLTFADFDAAAAVRVLAGLLDLPAGQEPSPAFQDELLAALMPEGAMDFLLGPGGVKNASYDLTWQGSLRAGPATPMPTGSAMVTLTGMDAVMAALQSAPPDMGGQVLPVLGMAQAMAKPGADGALVWEIEAATPGSLKVNGTEMMGAPQ